MVKSCAALIGTLPSLRAESWSQDARPPARLGLMRSKERRALVDQSRTNCGQLPSDLSFTSWQ